MSVIKSQTRFLKPLLAIIYAAAVAQLFLPPGTTVGKVLRGLPFLIAPVFFVAVVLVAGMKDRPIRVLFNNPWESRIFTVSLLLTIVGTVTSIQLFLSGYIFYEKFFVSDLLKMFWILAIVVLLSFHNKKDVQFIYLLLVSLSLTYLLVGITRAIFGDLTNPHPILVGAVATLTFIEFEKPNRRISFILLSLVSVGAVFTQALLSTHRASIVVVVVVFTMLFGLISWRQLNYPGTIALFLGFISFLGLLILSLYGLHAELIVRQLEAQFVGPSLLRRLNEAQVVLFDQSYLQLLVGYGHGGVYDAPRYANLPRTATPEGFIHPIHIGPVLLIFRYGVLGGIFYLLLGVLLLVATVRLTRLGPISRESQTERYTKTAFVISYFTLFGLFIRFHAQSSLIDPVFGLTIGVVAFGLSTFES